MSKITLKITKQITLFCSFMLALTAGAQTPEGTWKISPVAAALAVGPNQGSSEWWSNDSASIVTRACFFDDTYVFNGDGSFENILGDETWLESWQGVSEGCGAPVAPHDGTNPATWTYDSEANTIIINGLGAYLGLPKVHNSGEDGTPADDTITYTVTSISESAMTIDINFGAGWWRFLMTKETTAGLIDNLHDKVRMFPNPVNHYLSFSTNSNENLNIQIFDIQGKSVLRVENILNSVNVSELGTGVYLVQITSGAEIATKKLIIE